MSFTFLSTRLTDDSYISSVDDAVRNLEALIASVLGMLLDTEYDEALFSFDTNGFITSLLTNGFKIYEAGATDKDTDDYVELRLDLTDTDNPVLIVDGKDGNTILEAVKIKHTDMEAGSVPIYSWVNDSGELSFSRSKDETDERVVLPVVIPGTDNNKEIIIAEPPTTADDIGKTLIVGSDLKPSWGIESGLYLLTTPTGIDSAGLAPYVLLAAPVGSSGDMTVITVTGYGQIAVKFTKPGIYMAQGMVQAFTSVDGAGVNIESKLVPAPSSELSAADVISSGGGVWFAEGTLGTGIQVGNCVFGGTIRISQDDIDLGDCTVAIQLNDDQNITNVGQWGYLSINRVSGYGT